MLEDFQNYHLANKEETRDWMESSAFVIAVPLAYVAAVVIAVAVALIAPDDVSQRSEAIAAVHGASH
jgi:hypothetical protein